MRIILLTASISRLGGGVSTALSQWSSELMRTPGLDLNVLALSDRYTQEDAVIWNGVQWRACPVVGPRSFGFAPRLSRELNCFNPDLVHLHGLWMYPSIAAARWANCARRPFVVSPHGMLDPWALNHSRWKKRLAACLYENRNLRRAACIHCLCESEAASVRAYGLNNPLCIIPNGVDLPSDRSLSPPRWASDLPEQTPVLLYLGRLHPKKGLLNLIRAWAAVPKSARQDWVLVIAGWDQGGHEMELRRLARELDLEANVKFVGPQHGEDKEATLARASAFILPSFSEGLPVAVLEAWAWRLPVLITPQCNLPEGFDAGAAIRIEPRPESIAQGLLQMLEMTDAERRQMGQRGRRLVDEKFSWPKIAQEMKEVYQWLLGAGPKPACVRID